MACTSVLISPSSNFKATWPHHGYRNYSHKASALMEIGMVLMENSIAIIHLLELAKNLTGIKKDFVEALQNLQSIVREKLLTTPVELEERKYYIGKVVQRENKILKVKEKLQMDYDQQTKLKKEEVFV